MLRNLILRAKASIVHRVLRRGWASRLTRKANPPQCGDLSVLVNSFYKAAFGRLADPEGHANIVHQLQSGISLDVLAEKLVGSAEFQTRHGSSQKVDTEYITALYRDGLGRRPDLESLAFWLAEGKTGATRAKVLTALAGSDEAKAKAATPTPADLPQIGDLSLLVNSLYKTAFGRLADEDGLANWACQLQAGVSLQILAEQLVGSAEFQTRHGSSQKVDTEYITALYRDGLGRQPDLESLAFWLAEGKTGATRAKVLAAVAGSDEAKAKTAAPAPADLPQV